MSTKGGQDVLYIIYQKLRENLTIANCFPISRRKEKEKKKNSFLTESKRKLKTMPNDKFYRTKMPDLQTCLKLNKVF